MYHVLSILLHRPFVADGHLYNTSRSIPVNSFLICASAADSIAALLRVYDRTFSVRHAPYLISYATYVAATIHVRIAARRNTASEARANLQTCLGVFRDNEQTNWAVRRAKSIVEGLIQRLGVNLAELGGDPRGAAPPTQARPGSPSQQGQAVRVEDDRAPGGMSTGGTAARTHRPVLSGHAISPSAGWHDIDGIIQSFVARGQNGGADAEDPGALGRLEDYPMPHEPAGGVVPGARDFGGGMGVEGNPAPWVGFLPGGGASGTAAASFDDLLFGFNGSALDSSFY